MTKNIVDSVLEINSPIFALLPTLRQIDFNGGYVNNWKTKSFSEYVRGKSRILLQRDHSGLDQGSIDFVKSLEEDSKFFDLIHIDPWKKFASIHEGLKETLSNINFIHDLNPEIRFEVGTEEAIRKFSADEIEWFLKELRKNLSQKKFELIEYVCIQSGVGLDLKDRKNTGKFSHDRLNSMIKICRDFGKKSKEHNGDYLSGEDYVIRFKSGLESVNIGPEIAQIETESYLECMNEYEIDDFYQVCLESGKWKKWVDENFDASDKIRLILICGHYNLKDLKINLKSDFIKGRIKEKLKNLIRYV